MTGTMRLGGTEPSCSCSWSYRIAVPAVVGLVPLILEPLVGLVIALVGSVRRASCAGSGVLHDQAHGTTKDGPEQRSHQNQELATT